MKLRRSLSQKRKTSVFDRKAPQITFFSILAKKFAGVAKTATKVALEDFEEKHRSKLCTWFQPSFDFEQKIKDLRRQFFFRVVTSAVRARRGVV